MNRPNSNHNSPGYRARTPDAPYYDLLPQGVYTSQSRAGAPFRYDAPSSSGVQMTPQGIWNPNAPPFQPTNAFAMTHNAMPPYVSTPLYERCPSTNYQSVLPAMAEDGFEALCNVEQFVLSAQLMKDLMKDQNAAILQEVEVGLEQLINEPDEFEVWSCAVKERLMGEAICTSSLRVTAEMIMQMSTATPNVQYNFARLCALLSSALPSFRQDCLLPALRRYHVEVRKALAPPQQDNLLLFFAELLDKLELKDGTRLSVLACALLEQLEDMLKLAHIKIVVQVLKLSGRLLETSEGGVKRVNALFTTLNALLVGHHGLTPEQRQQITSICKFRESGWGLNADSSYKSAVKGTRAQGILCGGDGQPLSEEERDFLEANFGKLDISEPSPEENDLSDDFEEFCEDDKTTAQMDGLTLSDDKH